MDDALAYRNDPEFALFLPEIPIPFTRQDAEEFVKRNIAGPANLYPTFAVESGGQLIGTVNLDLKDRAAMLGYAIARTHWGRGIAVEAARAVITRAFGTFDIESVWASTDSRHVRSRRVMEKLGMRQVSVAKAHHLDRAGEPVDEVKYEIFRADWDGPGVRFTERP